MTSRASKSLDLIDLPIFDIIMIISRSPDLPIWNENLPIYYKKMHLYNTKFKE